MAVAWGLHKSALSPEALAHFAEEAAEKVRLGQARIVNWDNIKNNPPKKLKILPIEAIPHKSKAFRSILDLSFCLQLKNGGVLAAVNDTTEKNAPKGAIDQIGKCLSRIIHAFAEMDENAKVFMAKWDIKDSFWRMDCAKGEEWNFAYVLPKLERAPKQLVIPTSLQMGWVESPPYFCAATETVRNIAMVYINTPVVSLPHHKFRKYVIGNQDFNEIPESMEQSTGSVYMVEVYVDDFMSLIISVLKAQLCHVATAMMLGIHNMFPPNVDDSCNPISEKKLIQGEGQ